MRMKMIKQRKQIQLGGDPCNIIWYGVQNNLLSNNLIDFEMIRWQAMSSGNTRGGYPPKEKFKNCDFVTCIHAVVIMYLLAFTECAKDPL